MRCSSSRRCRASVPRPSGPRQHPAPALTRVISMSGEAPSPRAPAGWRRRKPGREVTGMLKELAPEVVTAEQATLDRLRAGDEEEFGRILTDWSPAMLRVAAWYVSGREAAE